MSRIVCEHSLSQNEQFRKDTGMAVIDSAGATAIDTVQYLAKDLARALAFYRDVIGLSAAKETKLEHGSEFELSDGNAFGIFKLPEGMWYPCGGAVFAVPDIDRAEKRLREAGVRFYSGVMESPVCRIAWCE